MKVPLLDLKAQNDGLRTEIDAAIKKVLDSNGFILGSEVVELEKELAAYCRTTYAVGCASGTDALLLALMAFDIKEGDEVITTPYSFFATASSVTRLGAKPVFVDINPATYNIDVSQVEAKINERTKAIQPVHLYGQCAEMEFLREIGDKYNVPIVEDAAQAIGAERGGRRAGETGAIGCFSFYPSKNLGAMGDAGFMTTNDEALAQKLYALRVHGSFEKYYHKWVGLNSRLDAMQAAILRVKLPHLDGWTEARQRNAAAYRELFVHKKLDDVLQVPIEAENSRHIYNQFVIRVAGKRDELKSFLQENGIGTDVYYPVSLHLQECFEYLGYRAGDFPESERASKETLALPIYSELTTAQLKYVVDKIAEFAADNL
ncbi:MAG: DegT/DnrJ/EryC1/StrS family aminotransferase [Acidobacteriota bacterium]|nr:DegT/DnrJ/EryC1/StrS family aminotransferase [Acidobacteriota bacterium]